MAIKVNIIYKTEGVCGALGAFREDNSMGEGGVFLCWCLLLAFHPHVFPEPGKSESAETHFIQSKYFHNTSLVSHEFLLYQPAT